MDKSCSPRSSKEHVYYFYIETGFKQFLTTYDKYLKETPTLAGRSSNR